MYPQGMSERGQLDAKIAELLALLNAPDDKVLENPQDESCSRPEDSMSDQALPDQSLSDESLSPQEMAAPEETRFAKYVTSIMQRRKA